MRYIKINVHGGREMSQIYKEGNRLWLLEYIEAAE